MKIQNIFEIKSIIFFNNQKMFKYSHGIIDNKCIYYKGDTNITYLKCNCSINNNSLIKKLINLKELLQTK